MIMMSIFTVFLFDIIEKEEEEWVEKKEVYNWWLMLSMFPLIVVALCVCVCFFLYFVHLSHWEANREKKRRQKKVFFLFSFTFQRFKWWSQRFTTTHFFLPFLIQVNSTWFWYKFIRFFFLSSTTHRQKILFSKIFNWGRYQNKWMFLKSFFFCCYCSRYRNFFNSGVWLCVQKFALK